MAVSRYDYEQEQYILSFPIKVVYLATEEGMNSGFTTWAMGETWQEIPLENEVILADLPCSKHFIQSYSQFIQQLQKSMMENIAMGEEHPRASNGQILIH